MQRAHNFSRVASDLSSPTMVYAALIGMLLLGVVGFVKHYIDEHPIQKKDTIQQRI